MTLVFSPKIASVSEFTIILFMTPFTQYATMEVPQQHKQPSRKGKKAWRKNVDVSDVQAGLEQAREELIKGLALYNSSRAKLENHEC